MLINMNRHIFIILVLGLSVRLMLFFHFLDTPKFFWEDDSTTYIHSAENTLTGNGFSLKTQPPYIPDPFRTPGYPVFLMIHKILFGSYYAALITQLIMAAATAFIFFLLAKEYGSLKIGYLSSAIFIAMPFSIGINLKFMTQTFFTFILALAVWYWIKFLKYEENKHLLAVAILLPLLALIRPIAQFVYLPFLISFIYTAWIGGKLKARKIARVCLIIGAIFFVGIFPWLFRNYLTFGHFSLSSIISLQMYFYDAPAVYAHSRGISYSEASKILLREAQEHFGTAEQTEFDALFSSGAYLKERAWGIIFESPVSFIVVRTTQFIKFFIRDGIHYWFEDPLPRPEISLSFIKSITPMLFLVILERIFLSILFLGMITTAILSFWDKNKERKMMTGFLILVILYFAGLSGIMSSAGLRYPIEGFFILLGLLGIQRALWLARDSIESNFLS